MPRRGYDVVAVEPNDAMRAVATASGLNTVAGTAEATGLAPRTARLVTAAQAWHWFDPEPTLREWRRIATETGAWAVVLWNFRVATAPFNAAYDAVLAAHVEGYGGRSRGEAAIERLLQRRDLVDRSVAALPHHQTLDWTSLVGRAKSSSYVAHQVSDVPALERDLREAFEAHASHSGEVVLQYTCRAVAWRLSPRPSAE